METAVPRQEKLSVATRQLREKRRQMKRSGIDVRHIEYTSICKAIRQRLKEEISNYNEKEQLKALKKQQRSQGHQRKQSLGRNNIVTLREEDGTFIEDRDRLISDLYNGATSVLKLHRDSDKIKLERGAREGDNISPKLLTACVQDAIIQRLDCMER